MAALNQDRNTACKAGTFLNLPVAANKIIYAGSLVAIDAEGNAIPGATATGLKAAGRANEFVSNNPGLAGAKTVVVQRGVFKFANAAADLVTGAGVLSNCYIVDDQTVAATNGGNTRSVAGKVLQVDTDGVWVEIL